jgi:hypothetical protein
MGVILQLCCQGLWLTGQNGVVFPLSEQLHTASQKIQTANITFNTLAKSALTYQPVANHDLMWYLSQVGTYVANKFPPAAASCGNVWRNVSAYETGNGTMNAEHVLRRLETGNIVMELMLWTTCASITLMSGQGCHMNGKGKYTVRNRNEEEELGVVECVEGDRNAVVPWMHHLPHRYRPCRPLFQPLPLVQMTCLP